MPRPSSSIPQNVTFFRAGWRDTSNYKDGLKPKERLSVSRNEEGESAIQTVFSETKEKEEVKEMAVFVRRRHFPIFPETTIVKTTAKKESAAEEDTNTKNNNDDDDSKPHHQDPNHNNINNQDDDSSSAPPPLESVTKDLSDVINIVLLDEQLPIVRKRETTVDVENDMSGYNIPLGARVVGDRVIIPAKQGLFGSTEETSLPLSFYKKSDLFGANNGGSLFGGPSTNGSLFGQAQNVEPIPFTNEGLFGTGGNKGSGLFGGGAAKKSTTSGIFGAVPAQSGGFSFGAPTKGDPSNLFGFDDGPKKAAKPTKAPKPAKVSTAGGKTPGGFDFGAMQQQVQMPAFNFGEPEAFEF